MDIYPHPTSSNIIHPHPSTSKFFTSLASGVSVGAEAMERAVLDRGEVWGGRKIMVGSGKRYTYCGSF